MSDKSQLTLDLNNYTKETLDTLAKNLNTTPAGVLAKALVMFKMAQGRKVVFKNERTKEDYVVDAYKNQPAQKVRVGGE